MRKKGFTLIEVMVVMMILTILAAIAFPTYQKYKKKAEADGLFVSIAATSDAMQLYLIEHGNLDGLTVDPDGGPLRADRGKLGVEYPQIEGLTYTIQQASSTVDASRIAIISRFNLITNLSCMVITEFRSLDTTAKSYLYTDLDNELGANTPGIQDVIQEYNISLPNN